MREVCFAIIALTLLSACERSPSEQPVQPQLPAAVAKPIEPRIPIELSGPLPATIAPSHPATPSPNAQPTDKVTAPVSDSARQAVADSSLPPIVPLYPPRPTSATPAKRTKYLPHCPGMSTANRRVAGSNCFGILPAECGADKAAAYVGLTANAKVRKAVTTLVGHDNIRWTPPGQAEIENLLRERLNMLLDKSGRIRKVDCY